MSSDKINPMLSEFLDCSSSTGRLRVLNKHRHAWTVELLTVIEVSMELAVIESDDTEEHYRQLVRILEMKKKYEEPGIR